MFKVEAVEDIFGLNSKDIEMNHLQNSFVFAW